MSSSPMVASPAQPVTRAVTLSVLVTCRDRDPAAVARHLESLRNQSYRDYELVFVDSGSDSTRAERYRRLVESVPNGRYIFADTRGHFWNKSRAINAAARVAEGRFFLTLDVDLILASSVLQELAGSIAENTVLCGRFIKLPRGFRNWEQLPDLTSHGYPLSEKNASGAIQLIPRDAFYSLRGADEYFSFWGVEDIDFTRRLTRYGCTIRWIDIPPVFHQWHPPRRGACMPEGWWLSMNVRVGILGKLQTRNGEDWGKFLGSLERVQVKLKANEWRREFTFPRFKQIRFAGARINLPQIAAFEVAYIARCLSGAIGDAPPGGVVACRVRHSLGVRLQATVYKLLFFNAPKVDGRRFINLRQVAISIIWHILMYSSLCDDYRVVELKDETLLLLRRRTAA